MKAKNYLIIGILAIFAIAVISQSFLASAQLHDVNISSADVNPTNPTFLVQVIKYEPYPVNAGDWFDLWIKVQNIGQKDAPNARFVLAPEYPFYSDDTLVRDYGIVPGTINAFKVDQTASASQVILKYRVKVADSAPDGDSNIKILVTTNSKDSSSPLLSTSLPITIGKTKTDFDVVFQGSSSTGTSFALSNIGSMPATAITLSLLSQPGIIITGPSSSIIGNLAAGDYTTVSYQLSQPNITASNIPQAGRNRTSANSANGTFPARNITAAQSVTLQIAYTDSAGVRNFINKTVAIGSLGSFSGGQFSRSSSTSTTSKTSNYIYLAIGLLAGLIIFYIYSRMRKKS